jgi:imidazolonepropionase
LSYLGGARLAASYGALSADHLEYLDAGSARAMAASGTVAVLLPGAFYAIRETQKPDIAALRENGVRIAIATDCNPGTSPLTSLLLTMNMAATLFGLTVAECLAGTTREAARALGLAAETGTLEAGKSADLAVWDVETPAELVYRIGFNPLHARIFKGERIAQ